MDISDLRSQLRTVPDFPKPGVNFIDITTLLENPVAFNFVLRQFKNYLEDKQFTKIIGIEARGFIFASALAAELNKPLVLARKAGKLPSDTIAESYDLEYGSSEIEIHTDSIEANDQVIIVDDLLATGGTMVATCKLVERMQAQVCSILTLIGLTFLPFNDSLANYDYHCLLEYDQ